MKLKIILFVVCAFVFSGLGAAKADDISDLKEQIKALREQTNTLNAKVQELETKQEAQGKEIKKVPELAQKVTELKERPAGLLEGTNVGGHLKMYMFDRTQGERNADRQHTTGSAGINSFYLYVTKEIADWLKVEVQPSFSVSAGATPSLDSKITRATSTSVSTDLYQAFMTAALPQGAELKVGAFKPMFSEEYAKETWWHELHHQNLGLASLQTWGDAGAELYKNFDFDKWSLPVYVALLNGNGSKYADNNDAKTVFLHVAPEFFQTKLRLLSSLYYGRWDDGGDRDAWGYVTGADWKYQKFNLTGEYIYRHFDELATVTSTTTGGITARSDGNNAGYWVRAMYTFNPKWRALIKYSSVELYKTGTTDMRTDNYDTTSAALNYFLTPSSTIIAQLMHTDAERSDGSEQLKFNRFTLGWRTTF